MSETKTKPKLFLAPSMRFVVELATWVWLILAAIYVHWAFAFPLAFSLASLAMLNYPGDKRSTESKPIGFSVPGWTRISVEILSAGLGMLAGFYYGAYIYIGIVILIPQIAVTLISFALDSKRWLWMLGKREEPPEYVTVVHKTSKSEN